MSGVPVFDTHVVVDWSARSKPSPRRPSADAIWWAAVCGRRAQEPQYARTRREAVERLGAFVAGELDAGRRVLAGFDFPFGYPAGVAKRLTGDASALKLWEWLAERIEDGSDNANNRYAVATRMARHWPGTGPFWGRPRQWDLPEIPTREKDRARRADCPPERRIADRCAAGAKTVWQLAYAGSVGSQVLLGLPALQRLLDDPRIAGRGAVWPFQTGLRPAGASDAPLVVAEIYPSLLRGQVHRCRREEEILDRAQVRVNAAAFARLDGRERLAPLFAGPSGLAPEERRLVECEEAWILGLGHENALGAA